MNETMADDYQDRGLGSLIIPYIKDIARRFSKKRIMLYGGVLAGNERAIHFYKKHGFHTVGTFENSDANQAIDMLLSLGN